MSDEYPKALYRGDKQVHEHVIADGEEHEAHLRSTGYVDYLDLVEAEPEEGPEDVKSSNEPEEIDLSAYVPLEQFNDIAKRLLETEEQLDTAKGEYIIRINELKKENATLKYSAMDASELKAILDEKGVKYGSRDGKDVLVQHVLESQFPTE